MDKDNKDEVIAALSEMVNELTAKIVNLRVQFGLALKAKDKEIEELKQPVKLRAVENE
jgi:hypothetical protein